MAEISNTPTEIPASHEQKLALRDSTVQKVIALERFAIEQFPEAPQAASSLRQIEENPLGAAIRVALSMIDYHQGMANAAEIQNNPDIALKNAIVLKDWQDKLDALNYAG